MTTIHIVSDLHIDNWDTNLVNKYACGKRDDKPIKWEYNENIILVIAGDISDNFDLSIDYLNNISKYYKKIIFIDGNHEHVMEYPRLIPRYEMVYKLKKLNNNKLNLLSHKPYIIDRNVFIGVCGWWNYNKGDYKACKDYFKNWIDLNENETQLFHSNVHIKSLIDYYYLIEQINKYQYDNNIDNIIIITHTIPHRRYCKELLPNGKENKIFIDLLNTNFETIIKKKFSKINTWIFGHIHSEYNEVVDGINYISHPRGRVEDYNRTSYKPLEIII